MTKNKALKNAIFDTIFLYKAFGAPVYPLWVYNNLLKTKELKKIPKFIDFLKVFEEVYNKKSLKKDLEKTKIFIEKIKIAKKYLKLFKFIPYLKAVFLVGSVPIYSSNKNSDIDVLVICEKNKVWFVRPYMTLFFDILKIRRKNKRIKDKLCLNHFIDETNLCIYDKSLYSAFNYKNLIPIYIRDKKIYKKFVKKNSWIKNYFFNFEILKYSPKILIEENLILTKILEKIFYVFCKRPIYNFLKYFQILIIKKNPFTYKKKGRIIYSDKEIIFHPEPRGLIIEERFKKLLKKERNISLL